jgi:hypothetical protein
MGTCYKYHIVYRTTCVRNNKYYIGVHSTNNLDDGYIGSGIALKDAIKKYGKDSFNREILSFHNSRDLAEAEEKRLVTIEIANSKQTYNLVEGGQARGGYDVWNGSHEIEKWRKELRETMSGYNNMDFVANWKSVYDETAEHMVLLMEQDIPDKICLFMALQKSSHNRNIKLHKIRQYMEINTIIQPISQEIIKSYMTKSGYPNNLIKTHLTQQYNQTYRGYSRIYMDQLPRLLEMLRDNNISDSMMAQSFLRGTINYFIHIGVLTPSGQKIINIRTRFPNAQRKFAPKTLYDIRTSQIQKHIYIEVNNDNTTNQYKARFHVGRVQEIRI